MQMYKMSNTSDIGIWKTVYRQTYENLEHMETRQQDSPAWHDGVTPLDGSLTYM